MERSGREGNGVSGVSGVEWSGVEWSGVSSEVGVTPHKVPELNDVCANPTNFKPTRYNPLPLKVCKGNRFLVQGKAVGKYSFQFILLSYPDLLLPGPLFFFSLSLSLFDPPLL